MSPWTDPAEFGEGAYDPEDLIDWADSLRDVVRA